LALTDPLSPYDPTRARRTLFSALLEAANKFGVERKILIDGDERALSYQQLIRAAFALGYALKKGTRSGESIGVLLPTGIGVVISVFALSAYGRVPAMLNFTAGLHNLRAAIRMAKVKRVVTAHRFIELGKFESIEAELRQQCELVYLEDVRESLPMRAKAAAAIGGYAPRLVAARQSPDRPAAILFTSGTEGEPKGVVLSHANILANVEQVRSHLVLFEDDVLFNPLPTFHSFGLTVGALMPVYLGVKGVLHPTPRQPREVVRRIREHRATIVLATDTFVSQYVRAAADDDLSSLRLAVCGAERLHDETRQLVRRKCLVELLEGYGVTEASPVISANQPGANRPGTVGHVVHGLETRIEPVEGIGEGGRLLIRGPNVMLGYLHAGAPGEIQPPPDGWHDTGDVVCMDEDGYLAIRGRLKRFAKVAGETVSLTVVENCASALWPDHSHAAVAVREERRGESIVLVTTNPEASRSDLLVWLRNHGVSELAVPRRVIAVSDVPLLGSGKIDYPGVAKLAAEYAEPSPAQTTAS
jgi:acyl-[acyl-carrier-protein]-phospholipid O-acyltransferase/long-chain-fatty-acid--[acyl-carrier-protein] ligase